MLRIFSACAGFVTNTYNFAHFHYLLVSQTRVLPLPDMKIMPVYCYSLLVFVLHAIPGHALAAPGLGRGEGAWPIGGGGGGGCRPGPSHRLVFGVEQLDCVTHPRFWPKKKKFYLLIKPCSYSGSLVWILKSL